MKYSLFILIQAPERLSYDTFLRQVTFIHVGRCTRVSKIIANFLWRRAFFMNPVDDEYNGSKMNLNHFLVRAVQKEFTSESVPLKSQILIFLFCVIWI